MGFRGGFYIPQFLRRHSKPLIMLQLDQGSNMEYVQLLIGIAVLIGAGYMVWKIRIKHIRMSTMEKADLKYISVFKAKTALEKGKEPKSTLLEKYASQTHSRLALHELLKSHVRLDLFPEFYNTLEYAAQSYLADWLSKQEEIEDLPLELNLVELRSLNDDFQYAQCKVVTHHTLAQSGDRFWLAYVVYPKQMNDPYQEPTRIVCKFDSKQLTNFELGEYV